jgi:hypothetical protein
MERRQGLDRVPPLYQRFGSRVGSGLELRRSGCGCHEIGRCAGRAVAQPHEELAASEKLLTVLSTLAASTATAAICDADGLGGNAFTAPASVLTEVVIALVWLGKSDFAELTSVVASVLMVLTCDDSELTSPLDSELLSASTSLCSVLLSPQYAGLLLLPPQPAAPSSASAVINAIGTKIEARPALTPDLSRPQP